MTDRTAVLLQRAQPHRQALPLKYKDRFVPPVEVTSSEQTFMTEGVSLHFALAHTAQKLQALRKLMKGGSSLFDSQHERIKLLADAVDNELKVTQLKLDDLQHMEIKGAHEQIVKEILQARLFALTKEFKAALQLRTKSLRAADEKKRELSSAKSYASTARSEPSFMEETQTQQTQEELSFLQSRAEGVEHVERQLAELSTVFERLSMIVHEHELMLERIDANTDAALLHIEQSKVEVAKYHDSVSSNRNLAIKVFMIFVVFFAFYVVFLV